MNFLKKHKKIVIISSVLLVILITLIILMFTLFSLKNVEVKMQTEFLNITETMQEEIKAEIQTGGTVFFKNKDEVIKNIEKKYPYAKVINIETVIPNKFVIHLAERQEIYSISSAGKEYILDNELKILKIVSSKSDEISLNLFGLEFDLSSATEGSFLNLADIKVANNEKVANIGEQAGAILYELVNSYQINNRTIVDFKQMCKKLTFGTYEDYRTGETAVYLKIVDGNAFEIKILSPLENMTSKVSKMLSAYSDVLSNSPSKMNTHTMTVYTNSNGQDQVLLEEKN